MEINKETITENLNNPDILEDLYQSNKKTFSEIIGTMHNEDSDLIIKYWHTRLFYKPLKKKGSLKKYIFTAFLILLAWTPIRLIFTDLFRYNIYLLRAIPIIFSVTLSLFFLFEAAKIKNIILSLIPNIILYVYFILLPDRADSQSINNAFYFMFVLLWFCVLASRSNYNFRKLDYNIFLEKCGETIVWSTMFIMGGIVIVGLSILLFNAIGIYSSGFYLNNIATLGAAACPFVSLLVIDNNSKIKLSVIIANIFLPIILISLAAFGIVSIFSEIKPYDSRNIFIIYNVMTVIVICVLVFTGNNDIDNRIINTCSYILPVATIILNIITLSAAIYRLSEYGITANKIMLLGTNMVMLGHLIFIIYLKFKHKTERNILYLPVYFIWSCLVVFVFPFIFKFQ